VDARGEAEEGLPTASGIQRAYVGWDGMGRGARGEGARVEGTVSAILQGSAPEDSRYIHEGKRPIEVKSPGSWCLNR
jgi:hypothetical protein